MSTMRKIIIPLLLFIYLIGSWCVSALLVLLTLFLYWYERNDKTFDD